MVFCIVPLISMWSSLTYELKKQQKQRSIPLKKPAEANFCTLIELFSKQNLGFLKFLSPKLTVVKFEGFFVIQK